MARKISDEIIKLSIVIDGNEAQKEILDQEKAVFALKSRLKELTAQEKARRGEFEKATKSYTDQKNKLEEVKTAYASWNAQALTAEKKLKDIEQQSGRNSAEYKEQSRAVAQLEREGQKLWSQQDKLSSSVIKLQPHVNKVTNEYQGLKSEISKTSKAIDEGEAKIKELTGTLKINEMTIGQLQARAKQIAPQLRHMAPNTDQFKKLDGELQQINGRLDELRGKGKEASSTIGNMADKFNRYAALAASVVAGLTGIVLSIQKMIDFNGKLSDAMTNVQKTTGMTRREVDELGKSFGMLRTRTARIELFNIAEVGGRLGIAKEEMADFVKVMDKSSVALGDSFEGGADVVAEKLGRIKGLYEELRNSGVETAFESVGSALNDLGADGTASEANLAEFATRVGAMPESFKPSIQEALGMGAAFEESGLRAEVAANNYSKMISVASKDLGPFATIMKRSKKDLEDLINTNPNEFFLQFASSLKGLSATDLGKVLDYLKLNDQEVKMVLGAASQNVDLFREKIALASNSMSEATSLTTEYDLKNSNLAATLERLHKKIIGWFTSDTVVSWLTSAVDRLAKLIGAVEDSEGSMSGLRNIILFTAKVLAVVIASLLSYTAGTKLATLWSTNLKNAVTLSNIVFRIQYAQLVAQEIATKGLALAKALLSGNITRVKAAYQALTVAMGMNPFGALLAVIGAVIAAFVVFRNETDNASKAIKAQAEIQKEVADQTGKTKQKITDLLAVIKDENATYDQKKKALEELRRIGKGYLEDLTMENILTAEGSRLIDRYIKSIDQMAKAKAMMNVKSKLEEQRLDSDNKILALSLEKKANTNEGAAGGGDDGKIFGLGSRNKKEIQMEIDEEKKNREAVDYQIKAMSATREKEINRLRQSLANNTKALEAVKKESQRYKELQQDIKSDQDALNLLIGLEDTAPEAPKGNGVYVPDGDGDKAAEKARKKADDAHKKRMADLAKQIEEVRELKRKAIDDEHALMKDGFEKDLVIQNEAHSRKLDDLKRQLISEADLKKADDNINSPKSSKRDVDFWTKQKEVWLQKNEHLNNLIRIEEQTHYAKLGIIVENEHRRQIKKLEEQYKREKTIRETNYLAFLNSIHSFDEAREMLQGTMSQKELDKIKTLEQAKKALKEDFDKKELAREIEFLETSITAMEKSIQSIPFMGMDLNLLTPEQREKIEKDIEFARNAAEKLKASFNSDSDSNPGSEADKQQRNKEMGRVFQGMNGGADILGFTPEQWQMTYDNLDTLNGKLTAGAMVVQGLQNLWGQYDAYMTASENNRLRQYEKGSDSRKRKLKWELDNGYINQVQYKRGVEQLDAELEKKKAEIEYKQAKRKKAMAIVETIMNTSIAIMQAFSQLGPIGGAIAAVLIGTMGALQIKTISEQPLPARGYEKGLYPEYVKREQDGKVFKSTYGGKTKSGLVRKPTYFLTGENGPEMVIDNKAYSQLSDETRNALIRELRGIKGFENGYYSNDVTGPRLNIPPGPDSAPPDNNPVSMEYLLSVINRNSDVMERALNEGFTGYISRDPRELKELQEQMERVQQSRNKAKI